MNKAQFGTFILGIAFAVAGAIGAPGCVGEKTDGTDNLGGAGAGGRGDGSGGMGGTTEGASRSYLSDVAYADGTYIAVGERDSDSKGVEAIVLKSADSRNWTLAYEKRDQVLQSVTRGPDAWYAVGGILGSDGLSKSTLLLTSEDGTTWNQIKGPKGTMLTEIAWTGSLLLVAGREKGSASEDGISWSKRNDIPAETRFVEGKSSWLAWSWGDVSLSGNEGVTFEPVTVEPEADPGIFRQSYLGFWPSGGGFDGFSEYSCCFGEMPQSDRVYSLHSDEGTAWAYERSGLSSFEVPSQVVEKNGTMLGVRSYGGPIFLKEPAQDWSVIYDDGSLEAIIAGDRFVAVGFDRIVSSEDGVHWESASLEFLNR